MVIGWVSLIMGVPKKWLVDIMETPRNGGFFNGGSPMTSWKAPHPMGFLVHGIGFLYPIDN